eukprot:72629-Chlamydomonas_euryale.AAC.1
MLAARQRQARWTAASCEAAAAAGAQDHCCLHSDGEEGQECRRGWQEKAPWTRDVAAALPSTEAKGSLNAAVDPVVKPAVNPAFDAAQGKRRRHSTTTVSRP